MARVLIVDDEPAIRESVAYALERDGFETRSVATLSEARQAWSAADCIVLDLMLPDGSGTEFLTWLRSMSRVAVVVLTSRDEETDRVVGLELGADDYVVKPFSPRELVARIRAILRRTDTSRSLAAESAGIIEGPGGLTLDPQSRRVHLGPTELTLSRTEFDVLAALLKAPGRVFSRDQLLQTVWGPDCVVTDRTVDVHIKTLRKKIEQVGGAPELVETVRGVGYRLRERDG